MQKTKTELNPLQQQTILAQLNAIAIARGGMCLTEQYKNSNTIMAWQCGQGHQWHAKGFDIKTGDWCPICYKADRAIAMTALAAKHGGECKSSYVDEAMFLTWRCAEGHCWSSLPHMVEKGVWCQQCVLQKTSNKTEAVHQLAQKLGEVCLSHRYVNAKTRLLWQCKNGHSKVAVYSAVLRGHGCKQCDVQHKKDRQFARLVDLARELGGDCLSETYENITEDLRWRCGEGHEWVTTGDAIRRGQWCALCAGYAFIEKEGGEPVLAYLTSHVRQKTLHKLQATAIERGGACLSVDYVNSHGYLAWQCAHGHEWKTPHGGVAQGAWCPTCAHNKQLLGIEAMHALAANHGGKCLSKRYTNNSVKLKWQCKEGHRFEIVPSQVQAGYWCVRCNETERKAQALEDLKRLAIAKGGECLSTSYVSSRSPIQWRCAEGHQWTSNATAVNKHWCPVCSGYRLTIDSAHKVAANNAGKCLSTEYINCELKLSWQCEFGHVWNAPLASIKNRKSWCPECLRTDRMKSRADCRKKKKNVSVAKLI
jgi:hypothetical protein